MGFAFEDDSGIPILAIPEDPEGNGKHVAPPLALHVEPSVPAPPSLDVGEIMVRAQEFAEKAAEEAAQKARAVIAEAQVEAAAIVSRARREAEETSAQAPPPIAPEAIFNLCFAIEEFANTNRILVGELVQLRHALIGPYASTPVSENADVTVIPPTAS